MNDSTNHSSAPRRQWLTPGTFILLLLAVAVIGMAASGEAGREALRYQRDAILVRHEYWRLLSGHLVHGSWQHTWLNLAGLGLIASLFRDTYTLGQWLVVALASAACIDLGLLFLMPDLYWYVGLSGVLHGALAAGALAWWRKEETWLAALLTAILICKLGWEQWQGALPLSGELNVIVNAHLYGAVGGLLAGMMFMRRLHMNSVTPRSNLK